MTSDPPTMDDINRALTILNRANKGEDPPPTAKELRWALDTVAKKRNWITG